MVLVALPCLLVTKIRTRVSGFAVLFLEFFRLTELIEQFSALYGRKKLSELQNRLTAVTYVAHNVKSLLY